MAEAPDHQRGKRRRTRSRLGRALSATPRWAKQAGTFLVGAAAVVGAMATIISHLKSSPLPILTVDLGAPEWAAHELTLGSYVAWQQRESSTQGLKALGEDKVAQAPGSRTASIETKSAVVLLVRYTPPMRGVDVTSTQPASTEATTTAKAATTTATGSYETVPTGTSSNTGPSSPTSTIVPARTTPPATTTAPATNTSPDGTVSTTTHTVPGTNFRPSFSAGVLREAGAGLGRTGISRLQRKVQRQEAILRNPELQQSEEVLSACQGLAYGGCAPEATTGAPNENPSTVGSEPSPLGTESSEATGAYGALPKRPTQSQRELLEIAGGARLGRAADANLVPPLMTTGLSEAQRVRVARVLGDAVSFEVHTQGWIGQRLLLTWTMYEKHDGYWNPSPREYLIDHAQTYVVPTASDAEGVLTFWFPIPRQQGDYEVHYFIRAPDSGGTLASGRSQSFRP